MNGELIIERAAVEFEPVGDGWTVYGCAVPYSREVSVSDDGHEFYREEFAPFAFSRDVTKGGRWVNLMLGHHGDDGDRFLGRCIALEENAAGLFPSFRINREHPQAEAARAGELAGWSVSAHVYRSRRIQRNAQTVMVREVCGISHVAATTRPQYAGAGVLVAREHSLLIEPSATPRLDALRAKGYGRALEPIPGQKSRRPVT
jgi:HK97 family phage prohead protease